MAATTEGIAERILGTIGSRGHVNSYKYASEAGLDHQVIVGAIKSLESLGDVIHTEQQQVERWELTQEGLEVVSTGSHEFRVYLAVDPQEGTPQSQLMSSVSNAKIGFSKAMSNGWLKIDKTTGNGPRVFRKVTTATDTVKECLESLKATGSLSDDNLKEFKKRKLISNM